MSSAENVLFKASPRPGGAVKIRDAGASKAFKGFVSPFNKKKFMEEELSKDMPTSRSYRIESAMHDSPWTSLDDSEQPSSLKYSGDFLGITLGTIMLMAAGSTKVPEDSLTWSSNFLSLVKDDFGQTPPNAQGIINHIKTINPNIVNHTKRVETVFENQDFKHSNNPRNPLILPQDPPEIVYDV